MVVVPDNIRQIITKLAEGEKVSESDLKALLEYIDEKKTSLMNIMQSLGVFEYGTYQRILRMLRPLKGGSKVIEKIEKAEEKAVASAAVARAKSIGKLKYEIADRIVAEHYATALELGYPETSDGITMFFKDAVNFYLNNMDIREEYEDLKAVTKGLIKLMKPTTMRLIAMKLIKSIAIEALKLAANGKKLDEEYLNEVLAWAYKRLMEVSGSVPRAA